jgi:hypothetical protein
MRPDILDLTLRSFCARMIRNIENVRLIINIDPTPSFNTHRLGDTVNVARRYFSEVLLNTPSLPSFPRAVKWGWEQVHSEFFLHLEDDWFLRRRVSLQSMAEYFEDPDLAGVTLNPGRNSTSEVGLALRPTLMRTSFVKEALGLFDVSKDPEKQWRPHLAAGNPLGKWKFRHYGTLGDGKYVFDIGAHWRRAHNLRKWGVNEVTWRDLGALGTNTIFVVRYKCLLWLGHKILDRHD